MNELHLGDCLDVMRRLPDGSFDAVITSPPYNRGRSTGQGMNARGLMGRGYSRTKRLRFDRPPGVRPSLEGGYASYRDAMDADAYRAWQAEVLRECWRLTHPERGAVFYNHKPRIQAKRLETPLDWNPGLPLRQIVYWAPGGGVNFSPTHYRGVAEWVCIFARPGFRLRSRSHSGCGDVWRIPYDKGVVHPAPFPVALVTRILDTAPIASVLDPFAGSGSTGVACVRAGVRFAGIELDAGYLATARRRIDAALADREAVA